MPYVLNLLTRGNGKLGEGIYTWSIPAIETCPGRSDLYSQVCYAKSDRFRTRLMQPRLAENLTVTQADDFVARITAGAFTPSASTSPVTSTTPNTS